MQAVSEAQHHAAIAGGMPEPEPIDDDLWSLPMRMPGDFLAYSLAVVHVGAGAVTVIDPGSGSDAALGRLEGFLGERGRRLADVETILITHSHTDHIGLAESLRAASGARILLHRLEQASIDAPTPDSDAFAARMKHWGVAPDAAGALERRVTTRRHGHAAGVSADGFVEDGELLPVDGVHWRALHTPGHTPGHLCIADEDRGILFSGDHVLPTVFPGVGLGSGFEANPVEAYLRSLAKLQPYDDSEVVPGHGYRFRGLHARRTAAADHALRRAREVAEIIAEEPRATTWDIASRLTWSGGWDRLADGWMLMSALSQTDMYREFVRAGGLDERAAH